MVYKDESLMKEKTFERKQELLDAALAEFSQKSYEEASINRIIADAGISKGTFYYHFKDKADLYLYLIRHTSEQKWTFIQQRMDAEPPAAGGEDIFSLLKLQAKWGLEFAQNCPEAHGFAKMLAKERSSIYDSVRSAFDAESRRALERMAGEAVSRGEIAPGFSQEFVVGTMSVLFGHFDEIVKIEAGAGPGEVMEKLDSFIAFLKNGLAGSKAKGEIHG